MNYVTFNMAMLILRVILRVFQGKIKDDTLLIETDTSN